MTPTYDLIASNVLTSSASSVTFSSIPATYRDLVLVVETLGTGTVETFVRFNSDSGSNYSRVTMLGDGSTTSSGADTSNAINLLACTATNRLLGILQIADYSVTDKHKTTLVRENRADTFVRAQAVRWANTAAINTVTATANANQFAAGATFHLYGIVS